MASLWILKWNQATLIFSWPTSKISFSISKTEPNLKLTAATSTTVLALQTVPPPQFIIFFHFCHLVLIYTWEISELESPFLISMFQLMATACLQVCTANLQIPTVICYFHLLVHRRDGRAPHV